MTFIAEYWWLWGIGVVYGICLMVVNMAEMRYNRQYNILSFLATLAINIVRNFLLHISIVLNIIYAKR